MTEEKMQRSNSTSPNSCKTKNKCVDCNQELQPSEIHCYGLCFDCWTRESLNDEEYYGENRYRRDETE